MTEDRETDPFEMIRAALEWAHQYRADGNDHQYEDARTALAFIQAELSETRRMAEEWHEAARESARLADELLAETPQEPSP